MPFNTKQSELYCKPGIIQLVSLSTNAAAWFENFVLFLNFIETLHIGLWYYYVIKKVSWFKVTVHSLLTNTLYCNVFARQNHREKNIIMIWQGYFKKGLIWPCPIFQYHWTIFYLRHSVAEILEVNVSYFHKCLHYIWPTWGNLWSGHLTFTLLPRNLVLCHYTLFIQMLFVDEVLEVHVSK